MIKIDLGVKKMQPNAILPIYHSSGASGFDLHSIDDIDLHPNSFCAVRTGLAFKIPIGFELQIRPRSGLAYKNGVSVLNTPGTIDSDYRGEVLVILFNFSRDIFKIRNGDRIAQAILSKVYIANLSLTDDLDITDRGGDGFGSTGV